MKIYAFCELWLLKMESTIGPLRDLEAGKVCKITQKKIELDAII